MKAAPTPLAFGRTRFWKVYSAPATLLFLLFLNHARHAPTSGPLHSLFALPGIPFPNMACSHSSFRSLLKRCSLVRPSIIPHIPFLAYFVSGALTTSLCILVISYLSVYSKNGDGSSILSLGHRYVPSLQHGPGTRRCSVKTCRMNE